MRLDSAVETRLRLESTEDGQEQAIAVAGELGYREEHPGKRHEQFHFGAVPKTVRKDTAVIELQVGPVGRDGKKSDRPFGGIQV